MKKLRLVFSLAAVCLALSVSSFTTTRKTTVMAHYTGTDDSHILNHLFYASGAQSGCNTTGSLPCTIEYDNSQTLQQYLDAEVTKEQVIADALTTRN